jgi:hypothetical protein
MLLRLVEISRAVLLLLAGRYRLVLLPEQQGLSRMLI